MKTTLNKTELAGALAALGKLVTRTAPVEANRAVEITGFADMLHFRTPNAFEEIEFTMFAEMDEDFPATLVNFEQFRLAVRNGKNKMLGLEVEDGEVTIDGIRFDPVKGHLPPRENLASYEVNVTELPSDTLSALEKLAPVTEKGILARKMLTGIDLSADGFTAANNKELSNIPLPLQMNGNVTIPFPLTLLATKAFGESGKLMTWQKDDETHFELALGNWTWRAKALKGNYPNWKRVLPERTAATHYVNLTEDTAERIQRYLKGVPDDPLKATTIKLSRIPEVPDHLNLASSNGVLVSVLAEFDDGWGDLSFVIRKELLAHLLNQGHTRIELNDACSPIVGTGGMGQYIGMPIITKTQQAQTEQKPEEAVAQEKEQPATQASPESTEQETVNTPTITNTTTSNQEKPNMNETPTITPVVSAPVQTFTPNRKPEARQSPIDELISIVDEFKAKLKTMTEESAVISRKAREIAIDQKQKNREYAQTKKTIERIRTASGF